MIEEKGSPQTSTQDKDLPTRHLILEKAFETMCLNGIKKLSMEDLAQRAGISRAAIYLHFKDRNEVIVNVLKKMGEKDLKFIRDIAAERSPAAEKLRRCLHDYVLLKINRCRRHNISVDELFGDFRPYYLEFRREMVLKVAGVFTEILVEGKLHGEFEFENAFEVAESLVFMIQAFMPSSLSNEELGDITLLQDRLNRVIEIGMKSILVQPLSTSQTPKFRRSAHFKRSHRPSPIKNQG